MIPPDVLAIIAGIVAVAGSALFTFLPLARSRRASAEILTAGPNNTAPRRFAIYRQLLDLELDHRTGKLSAEDQAVFTAELLAHASALLQEESQDLGDLDAAVEREIAAARQALEVRRASEAVAAPSR